MEYFGGHTMIYAIHDIGAQWSSGGRSPCQLAGDHTSGSAPDLRSMVNRPIDAQTRGRQGAQDRVTIRETEREHKVLIGATAGLKRAEGCVRSAGALPEENPVIIGIDIPANRSQGAIIDTSERAFRRGTGLAGGTCRPWWASWWSKDRLGSWLVCQCPTRGLQEQDRATEHESPHS